MKKYMSCLFLIISGFIYTSCDKEDPIDRNGGLSSGRVTPPNPPYVPPAPPAPTDVTTLFPNSTVIGNLSRPNTGIAATICNEKLFSAGHVPNKSYVDVFDLQGAGMVTYELSAARYHMAAVSTDSKVFIAGGHNGNQAVSRVDIYDMNTKNWSTAELSIPRYHMAVASIGNFVFFAGGLTSSNTPSSRVDIYDAASNTWSVAELSKARYLFTAAVLDNIILFAGGQLSINSTTDIVDVFNMETNKWTVSHLSRGRGITQSAVLNGKAYFVGNTSDYVFNRIVDVYDQSTGSWAVMDLNEPRGVMKMGVSNGKIAIISGYADYISGSNIMDVFNPAENKWSVVNLASDIVEQATLSYKNHIYSVGGVIDNENQLLSAVIRFAL